MNQGGDDLQDDFVIDELVALSADEDDPADRPFFSDDALDTIPAPETGDQLASAAVAKKRKRREKDKERKAKVCPFEPPPA